MKNGVEFQVKKWPQDIILRKVLGRYCK